VKVLVLLLAMAATARADSLGVVIEAPTGAGGPLRVRIESWAADQHHDLVAAPLSLDGAKTLANCIVVDDLKCASAVVDARGKADNVVYVKVDATSTLLYWFRKHHAAVRQKLACAPCSDGLLEQMLGKLTGKSEVQTSTLKLDSRPTGRPVTIDGQPGGTTPVEQDLEIGSHEIEVHDGDQVVARRRIRLEVGQPLELTLSAHAPVPETHAPRWPWYTMGAGTAVIATGVILYVTSESPTGAKPEYLNDRPIGTAIAIGGAGVVAVGAYFALTHSDTAPTVAMTPGGAVLGFATLIR